MKPAQISSYIEPTKQVDFLHLSVKSLFFMKYAKSTVRYCPFTYRSKNEVLLACFVKIFSPSLK